MARKHRRKPDPNTKSGPVKKGDQAPPAAKKKSPSPPTKSTPPQKPSPPPKGKPTPSHKPPQPRPVKETPQVLAEKLVRSFPPEFSKIQEYLKASRGVQAALRNGLISSPSSEELFYFIASCIETLAEDRIDRLFDSEYRSKLKELRVSAGLGENEFFRENDSRAPEEYHQLLNEFRQKKRVIIASVFREYRQEEAARLIQEDYGEYRRLYTLGRQKYLERDPVDSFIAQVVSGELSEER